MEFMEMPVDIVDIVLPFFDSQDLMNAALSCKGMLSLAAGHFPAIHDINVTLSDFPIAVKLGKCDGNDHGVTLKISDSTECEEVVKHLLPLICRDVKSLQIEDELINNAISDNTFGVLFTYLKDAPLKRLNLSHCDLSKLNLHTFALLAIFNQLERFEMQGCVFRFGENNLARILKLSSNTLTTVDIRDNGQITDNFVSKIAKVCPNLQEFRVSDCPLIATYSALALVESTLFRRTMQLNLYLRGTSFDPHELRKYMNSPHFNFPRDAWRLTSGVTDLLGYRKPFLLAEHFTKRGVVIHV